MNKYSPDEIMMATCKLFDLTLDEVLGTRRYLPIQIARKVFAGTCRHYRPDVGYVTLGKVMGRNSHSLSHDACRTFNERDEWKIQGKMMSLPEIFEAITDLIDRSRGLVFKRQKVVESGKGWPNYNEGCTELAWLWTTCDTNKVAWLPGWTRPKYRLNQNQQWVLEVA